MEFVPEVPEKKHSIIELAISLIISALLIYYLIPEATRELGPSPIFDTPPFRYIPYISIAIVMAIMFVIYVVFPRYIRGEK